MMATTERERYVKVGPIDLSLFDAQREMLNAVIGELEAGRVTLQGDAKEIAEYLAGLQGVLDQVYDQLVPITAT